MSVVSKRPSARGGDDVDGTPSGRKRRPSAAAAGASGSAPLSVDSNGPRRSARNPPGGSSLVGEIAPAPLALGAIAERGGARRGARGGSDEEEEDDGDGDGGDDEESEESDGGPMAFQAAILVSQKGSKSRTGAAGGGGGGGGGGEPPRRVSRSKADPNEPRYFNKKDDGVMLVLFEVGARSSARVGAVMRGRHHARGC